MSAHRGDHGNGSPVRVGTVRSRAAGRLTLATALLAGVAACSASPEYPINLGERAGGGGLVAQQPRYPVSAADAAQNAADVRAGRAYPAYGAPSYAAPQAAPYASPPPPVAAPPPADDQSDDAPKALRSAPVESSDLPPAGAAPVDAPPAPSDAPPHAQTLSFGGGQIVFGADSVIAPKVEFAAYRHHRHTPASEDGSSGDDTKTAAAKPSRKGRHHKAAAESAASSDTSADAGRTPAADTPYQTVVRPGEKLSEVAERVHASKEALIELNALKHPKHVKAGTVLKIPYKYTYEVQKGDTLYTISHRFGQDPTAIAKLNGLKTLPTLQPGESLTLPSDVHDEGKRDHAAAAGPAPEAAPTKLADAALKKLERKSRRHRGAGSEVDAASEAQVAASESAHGRRRHGVAPLQTASAAPLAEVPTSPAAPVPSESEPAAPSEAVAPPPRTYPPRSYRPSYATSAAAPATTPAPSSDDAGVRPYAAPVASAAAPSTYVAPGYAARPSADATGQVASLNTPRYSPSYPAGSYAPSLGRERPTAQTPTAGAVSSAEIATAGRGRFIWPLRGQITSSFGDKPTGEHNDGMDIAAAPGSAVKAAAAGEVVYAGSAIPGYGNLVLVKHAGGWVTAYAHLDRIEVRMRDSVSQGDEIGQAGQTLAGARPGLHFEVRYAPSPTEKARPVDPTLVLPAG